VDGTGSGSHPMIFGIIDDELSDSATVTLIRFCTYLFKYMRTQISIET
jgi:hypothetical protein